MHILLDEDVPIQVLDVLRHVLLGHRVEHVSSLKWKSKSDGSLYRDAKRSGYRMIVTNDASQLNNPDIVDAIKKSRMHWVSCYCSVRLTSAERTDAKSPIHERSRPVTGPGSDGLVDVTAQNLTELGQDEMSSSPHAAPRSAEERGYAC